MHPDLEDAIKNGKFGRGNIPRPLGPAYTDHDNIPRPRGPAGLDRRPPKPQTLERRREYDDRVRDYLL